MKKYRLIISIIFILFVVLGQLCFGLDASPVYTYPPVKPAATPGPFQTIIPQITPIPFNTPAPTPVPAPLDISIVNVVKEFQWTSTSGTYYRYYIWVERTGGDLSAGSIPLRITASYVYPHSGNRVIMNLNATFGEGSTLSVVTQVINTNPLSGGYYPLNYILLFSADPDNDFAESNEDNNTWVCDSVIDECANCMGTEECYP